MSFRVTNKFVGSPTLSAQQLDQNFTDVEAKFNGGITTLDLSTAASISNGQLSNSQYDLVVPIVFYNGGTRPITAMTSVALPPVAGGQWEIYRTDVFISNNSGAADRVSLAAFLATVSLAGAISPIAGGGIIAQPSVGNANVTGSLGELLPQLTTPVSVAQPTDSMFIVAQIVSFVGASMMGNVGDTISLTFRIRTAQGLST